MPIWNPDTTQKALRFASQAHEGQLVPGSSLPYIVHPVLVCVEVMAALRLGPEYDGELAVCCALLHDVLEDTPVSYATLEAEFGVAVAAGVLALSKDPALPKDQQLPDSLARICRQPGEIWLVKLADRISNLAPPPAYWSREKRRNYREDAMLILDALGSASPYLAGRLREKIAAYKAYIDG